MSAQTTRTPWLHAVAPASASRETEISDEELIEAVLTGDRRVAALIHDRLVGVIDQSLYRVMGRREHDHDDLIQSCFEQVLRTLTRRAFSGNCSLRTWAARISTNVALNALRSRCRERKVVSREVPIDDITIGQGGGQPTASVELSQVQRILTSMSHGKAEVLVLHDVHGYNLSEIAELLDVSIAAAQSRLVRGRKDFKKRYDKTTTRSAHLSSVPSQPCQSTEPAIHPTKETP